MTQFAKFNNREAFRGLLLRKFSENTNPALQRWAPYFADIAEETANVVGDAVRPGTDILSVYGRFYAGNLDEIEVTTNAGVFTVPVGSFWKG